MRFQLFHPNFENEVWTKIDVSTLENMIKGKAFPLNEAMFRTSITSLEDNTIPKVVNLGNIRLDIENVAEIDPTITILKKSLEISTDKK